MKKIKFNKNWLIGIVSGLLIVATLGTVAAVFVKNDSTKQEITRELVNSVVAGQTSLGRYASASGTLTYDYDYTLDLLTEAERGFYLSGVEIDGADDWVSLKLDGKNKVLNYGKNTEGASSMTFMAPTDEDGVYPLISKTSSDNRVVFETDIKWSCDLSEDSMSQPSGNNTTFYFQMSLVNGSLDRSFPLYGVKTEGSDKIYVSQNSSSKVGRCMLEMDEWYNLRVEFYTRGSDTKNLYAYVFLDNILVSNLYIGYLGVDLTVTGFNISIRQYASNFNLYFDNTYIGVVPN